MRHLLATGLGAATLLVLGAAVEAKPEFAAKEKKDCSFCHINPAGGGERNRRGQYYDKNKHSLAGLPLEMKSLWKLSAPADTRRIALGDVMGDKKPRVLVLGATEDLAVMSIADDKLVKDAELKLGPKAGSFFVGNLEKGKPAVIAVPGAIHYRSGEEFVKKSAPELTSITGTVKFEDGEECVFIFDSYSEPAVFGVDTSKTNPLTVGRGMVLPDQGAGIYSAIVARMSPDVISMLGWPSEFQQSGVFGLWDAYSNGTLSAWAPWMGADGSRLVFLDPAGIMGGGELKPTWRSDKLAGKILDVAIGSDPKGSKQTGMLLLLATGEGAKERTLEFLALD
ncbi:MAG: hypothetical protein GX446_16705 [Chthonomonadales bacterium]|nr:hypothetical protein [Chthonomonadales bacterium]